VYYIFIQLFIGTNKLLFYIKILVIIIITSINKEPNILKTINYRYKYINELVLLKINLVL